MIRPAEPSDIPLLLEMGEAFHTEAGWEPLASFDAASWQASIEAWIDSPLWRFLVADENGVCGFICGVVVPLYFNHTVTVAQELLWWVKPEHRRGYGGQLLSAFHRDADLGFQTVSETVPRSEVVQRKLQMDGWLPVERNFIKRLG